MPLDRVVTILGFLTQSVPLKLSANALLLGSKCRISLLEIVPTIVVKRNAVGARKYNSEKSQGSSPRGQTRIPGVFATKIRSYSSEFQNGFVYCY